jgi:hypothetical protein
MEGFSTIICYCGATKQPIWRISVADFGLTVMVNISRYGGFFRNNLLLQSHKTTNMARFCLSAIDNTENVIIFISNVS